MIQQNRGDTVQSRESTENYVNMFCMQEHYCQRIGIIMNYPQTYSSKTCQ